MHSELLASDDAAVDSVATVSVAPVSAGSPFQAVPLPLRKALEARGYDAPTAVQSAVLAADLEGRDLQISSQTGSGKTVALGFALAPVLQAERSGKGPDALIIVPTRELAAQVCDELGWLLAELPGVLVASVTGGNPMHRDRRLLAQRPRLLVGTPGRLLDHVTTGLLDLSGVSELVLDEADQMLDMGFREELEGILDATPTTRRTHMVSATFPDGIQRLAARYQREPFAIEGTRLGDANLDIEHEGHLVQPGDRYNALVNLLLQVDGERTLVFVERRVDALQVASRLEADGFAALPLSGELVQAQRERTIAAFRAGRATVLVATDVAARGLDVPDVATVIHTSPPIDSQVYTHRSGRTGRAGKSGRSVLLAPPNRRRKVARLLSEAGVKLKWLPVPDAAQVRALVATRARAAVDKDIDTAIAAGTAPERLAHAQELLATRDAASVVAALLVRAAPDRRATPKDVATPREPVAPRRGEREYAQRTGQRFGQPSDQRYGERPVQRSGGRPSRVGRFESSDAVRFFVNWGTNQGATPSRLLAAICRRGEVDGGTIGSIAIHPNASTFDVHADEAERFERLAGRRDPRDPRTMIRRDRGPQGPDRGPHGPGRGAKAPAQRWQRSKA